MVVYQPERVIITDKKSFDLLFGFIVAGKSSFAEFVDQWFNGDPVYLAEFLDALDEAGLEVRKKNG